MDLETENRIAAILLKEAAELRRQADKEGLHVYLQKPQVRGRPNSRFLTATVLGVQQANRAVEVNEMWRVRQKELELDDRLKGRSRQENCSSTNNRESIDNSSRSTSKRHAANDNNTSASCSSSKQISRNCYSKEDEGLMDDEVEEFLHSRVKRGRGTVGSRIDETGPYLLPSLESKEKPSTSLDLREYLVALDPEKPSSLKSYESSEEELDEDRGKKAKKVHLRNSDKKHSKRHRKKERSRDKKKSKKEKRSRH
ncbi:hypothetical protein P3X46_024836 [Hevea brasiliensis]|uniref:Uncharacterized protein n=1 Tax=Hevea brasiliensis TaxID=3981 RepID=A0ABQ9L3R6_HEVBR|nr:uncharacterized protein LOC110641296 [Hevea brasiliensis]KAJ9159325.1 hypothetical protein P3X46_024836 [Hevea brasiliensis]